ncbi:hypothetical protein OVS_03655 [Mycoplasma ovis str. Michigan]|uniref:Uncharacterized protein n=1 Tax=Mycoplasma ovis str. Michigan TaxID=1415773 RepID=A0ABM5P277_9MOLU|nr:hypothetical protein [Mycoplasma ovis]AHC40479.1 hypothetical protein OVS_03655 [Mycoplasma ovis str. Michigan]
MILSRGFLPLLVGVSSSVSWGTSVFPYFFGLDKYMVLQVEGSESKEWVKLGSQEGEGIFFKSKGTYKIDTSNSSFGWRGPARIGYTTKTEVNLDPEDKTFLIVSGEKGIVLFRGKRHFQEDKDLDKAIKVNNEVWNQGKSDLIKDEDPDYYCSGRTEQWKTHLNNNLSSQMVGYLRHPSKTELGNLRIISLVDTKSPKFQQTKFQTNCRGIEIFFPETVTFFKESSNGGREIEVKTKTDRKDIGHVFEIGKVESVLYGRNKDLNITERGIVDGIGNLLKWNSKFFPEIKLKPVN